MSPIYPLVGRNIPFVSNKVPFIGPFIGRNLPLIFCTKTKSGVFYLKIISRGFAVITPTKNPIPWPQAGFTLMELMIGIAIGAILLALAAPNMGDFIKNYRITTETNEFIAQVNSARSQAIKRGTIVILCRSTTATATTTNCDTGAGNAKNWTIGWIMYALDTASTAERDYVLATDTLLARSAALDNGIRITTNSYAEPRLAIRSDGTLLETGATRFALCDDRNETNGRVVEVSLTGRPTVLKTTAAGTATDCTPDD